MLDLLRTHPAFYTRPPCSTCKPGPDGVPAIAWMLIALGVGLMLLGFGVLVFAARSGSGSRAPSAASRPAPVMDAVQREELERRAAEASGPEKEKSSDTAVGGGIVLVGVAAGVLGLLILGITGSRVSEDKNQLHLAAANLVSSALDGPAACRRTAGIESYDFSRDFPSATASNPYLSSPEDCSNSPREYANQNTMSDPGVFISVKYVFSDSFGANGQVTVHDEQDNRSLCVTVPDAVVEAAAPPTDGPGTRPSFDDVTVNPSPYITDGVCPDAPVSSANSY